MRFSQLGQNNGSIERQELYTDQWLQFNNVELVDTFIDRGKSARTFDRPDFIKLKDFITKHHRTVDYLLVDQLDRFSRDAGEAMSMVKLLQQKYSIQVVSVTEGITFDYDTPGSFFRAGLQLLLAEEDNINRSIKVKGGIYTAKAKEGRYVYKNAPYGYRKEGERKDRKLIVEEAEATAMLWAFNEIAKGVFACDQVRQKMNKLHKTTISRSAFHVAVRNPLYYGKIFISKFKDEEAHLVQGQHEPLISKELFDRVQLILDGNKRTERPNTKIFSDENLPLRGFLVCPECGRNLTGSASKGRTNRYYYYHCVSSCGFRQKAELANDIFEKSMRQFELNSSAKIVKRLLLDNYKKFVKNPFDEKKQIAQEIDKLNARLSVARNKLLSEIIDDEEYLEIKDKCRKRIESLEEQLSKDSSDAKKINIEQSLDRALKYVENVPKLYSEGEINTRRSIIGSIFPEKLEFDGKMYRTARMNVIANYISFRQTMVYSKIKTGQTKINFICPV